MGSVSRPQPFKLIVGLISAKEGHLTKARDILSGKFGKIDFESGTLQFNHTDYYESEFGKDLKRKFLSFAKLIPPQQLWGIKIYTNKVEQKLAHNRRRQVNIDPGYIDASKLVLLSTKDFIHRIHLGGGIFAEVTLFFKDKTFNPWPWTYPDYRTTQYLGIFNNIRDIYLKQIKEL